MLASYGGEGSVAYSFPGEERLRSLRVEGQVACSGSQWMDMSGTNCKGRSIAARPTHPHLQACWMHALHSSIAIHPVCAVDHGGAGIEITQFGNLEDYTG